MVQKASAKLTEMMNQAIAIVGKPGQGTLKPCPALVDKIWKP